jgi:hypothetical protein
LETELFCVSQQLGLYVCIEQNGNYQAFTGAARDSVFGRSSLPANWETC